MNHSVGVCVCLFVCVCVCVTVPVDQPEVVAAIFKVDQHELLLV